MLQETCNAQQAFGKFVPVEKGRVKVARMEHARLKNKQKVKQRKLPLAKIRTFLIILWMHSLYNM